jgi:hypothetical protein
MSVSIKKLILVVKYDVGFELTNLPFSLEKLTIVYDTEQTPTDFYHMHKSKIKLPYGCKLKIIQDWDVLHLDVDLRHLNIADG